jgi:hypothetical protein
MEKKPAKPIGTKLDPGHAQGNRQISSWAWSVCILDGVLPLLVVSVPGCAAYFFPRVDDVAFILLLPFAALLVRYAAGAVRFERGEYYFWQICVFGIAVACLFYLDFALIAYRLFGMDEPAHEWLVVCGLYLSYLAMMAVASFPFRRGDNSDYLALPAQKN